MGNGTPEHCELEAKGNTVNGVILSEADYLDQIRIPDYSMLMKNYLKSRAMVFKTADNQLIYTSANWRWLYGVKT